MSATGKTTNLELPLYIGSDTTSWLTDFNGAMLKLDSAIKEVTTENDGIELIANGASTKADTANVKADANATAIETVSGVNDSQNATLVSHTASINGLQTDMSTATTNIAKNATDIDGIKADIVEIQGDTNLATQVSANTSNIGTLTTAQNNMSNILGTTDFSSVGADVSSSLVVLKDKSKTTPVLPFLINITTNGASYTATKRQVAVCHIQAVGDNTGTAWVKINNIFMLENNNANYFTIPLYLNEGDVLTTGTAGNGTAYSIYIYDAK